MMRKTVDLSNGEWRLARLLECGEPVWTESIPARVPGNLLDDLWRAGVVPDPYYAENFRGCAWTGEWTFWYRTEKSVKSLSKEIWSPGNTLRSRKQTRWPRSRTIKVYGTGWEIWDGGIQKAESGFAAEKVTA